MHRGIIYCFTYFYAFTFSFLSFFFFFLPERLKHGENRKKNVCIFEQTKREKTREVKIGGREGELDEKKRRDGGGLET